MMMNLYNSITFSTAKDFEIVDITSEVESLIKKNNVKNGLCTVFVPHATAALILNENEPGLLKDYEALIKKLFPPNRGYAHDTIDNNAHSHLAAAILKPSITLPVISSQLMRGTWQSILFVELDGPRSRRNVVVQII